MGELVWPFVCKRLVYLLIKILFNYFGKYFIIFTKITYGGEEIFYAIYKRCRKHVQS